MVGVPVHLVALSENEEPQVQFITREKCIAFDSWQGLANNRVQPTSLRSAADE
jgi:hypothetical protein